MKDSSYEVVRGQSKPHYGVVVNVCGSVDSTTSESLRRDLIAYLPEAKRSGGLVVDLSEVAYASSTGVGALVLVLSEAKKNQIPLYLQGLGGQLRSVMEILGFISFFELLS